MCGHAKRANRNKKRFKCRSCSHQTMRIVVQASTSP
ncbi:hypothetical protein [Natrinema versiforme]